MGKTKAGAASAGLAASAKQKEVATMLANSPIPWCESHFNTMCGLIVGGLVAACAIGCWVQRWVDRR